MPQPVFLTDQAFKTLIANLVQFEEEFDQTMNDFFPGASKEAEDFKRFFNIYIDRLNNTIRSIHTIETANNDFPYVIIGSAVVVKDRKSFETYRYTIVPPLKNQVNQGDISYLSPMGKALLLKNVYDNIFVEAPGGKFEYNIVSVKIATKL